MNVGLVSNSFSSITNGNGALSSAKTNAENSKFMDLLKSMQEKNKENDVDAGKSSLSSSQISANGRLNGDYTSGFAGVYNSEKDRQSNPVGAAANQSGVHGVSKKIETNGLSNIYSNAFAEQNLETKTNENNEISMEDAQKLSEFYSKERNSILRSFGKSYPG